MLPQVLQRVDAQHAPQRVVTQQCHTVDHILLLVAKLVLEDLQEGTDCAMRLPAFILVLDVLASLQATSLTSCQVKGAKSSTSTAEARAPTQHRFLYRSTCTWQAGIYAAAGY